jgi:hypothetical protein
MHVNTMEEAQINDGAVKEVVIDVRHTVRKGKKYGWRTREEGCERKSRLPYGNNWRSCRTPYNATTNPQYSEIHLVPYQ